MRRARCATAPVIALLGLLVAGGGARAQQPMRRPTPAEVSYVGVEGVYLSVGTEHGVVVGDTVAAFLDEAGARPIGRLLFTSVAQTRSVATRVGGSITVVRGDVVFVLLESPVEPRSERTDPEPASGVLASAPASERAVRGEAGARVSGYVALDLDARETRTAWTGELFGETRRRFATPTTRVSFVASRLPGGFSLRSSLRGSYRYADLPGSAPALSLRAYELAATRSFDRVPFEITLGRFSNPHEAYSAYWDGVLLRLGRTKGPGLGVVAGFEPLLYDEGISTDIAKLTAFADFRARAGGLLYDTDLSFHVRRRSGGEARRHVGWSQRLSLWGLTIDQRLRLDESASGGPWAVSDLRIRTGLRVVRPLRLRTTWRRSRPELAYVALEWSEAVPTPEREEVTLGLDLVGELGSASVDGGWARHEGSEAGLSLSASGAVSLGPTRFLVSGRRWTSPGASALSVAPGLLVDIAGAEWRGGYRLYRTEWGARTVAVHAAEVGVALAFTDALRLSLRAEHQWGASLRGTRTQLGLRHSF